MDLPAAPTPPVNTSGMPSNADRTANLLNLLKFSSSGASAPSSQQQHQQHQSPPHQHHPMHHGDNQQQHHHARRPSFGHGQYPAARIHQPAPTGADPTGLLAALMKGAHESEEPRQAPQPSTAHLQPSNSFAAGSPSADTRSYLLNLLNRPKPSQTDQPIMAESSRSNDPTPQSHDDAADTNRYYGQYQQPPNAYQPAQPYQPHPSQSESFSDVQHPASNVSSFSFPQTQESADVSALYHHVFGKMQQSSPQHHDADAAAGAAPFHILKKDQPSPAGSNSREQPRPGSERSTLASPPEHGRRAVDRSSSLHSHQSVQQPPKQTPQTSEFDSFSPAGNKNQSVADSAGDMPAKEDPDSHENLDRAAARDTEQPVIAEASDSEWTTGPRKATVWPSGPEATAWTDDEQSKDEVKRDLDDDPAVGPSESSHGHVDQEPDPVPAENPQAVVDSWESADQEEIVVIEEKEHTPVRVFNFPVKPWISITLQDDSTEPRPLLRDECIMDIARLKKDFDQIDRNLYTASQTYMTYGMSKQGGLRVIRQDDGKDAKVFTDTKDRIFNVAMSVAPDDSEGVHREAIIGTGVSGTVYWVQIKEGEKDHIEDTHLEQYGFALPPMSSQDGDTPGGVLKTRARASTMHPEYFAVGRGKTINFIWPSYIMHNKLFKTGHDRVVDTDNLLKQCSLKINTGKAGKDFTFSQDDTVVVSLDKSGRIKFWDVRDLTAAKEGSDPRAPMPAQTSLEIKEPLLTLSSTREGEKAWPTSVMLLDKQRPFQKRCALRYMIVGMKQNHTLQLWDLALEKLVQEFNLPHSKESDAVCSVMYHPTSGMIIIGHPTRNSVYFAHLSAPKYTLKGVSQAEYIQRLVAQDSSIPQPDSTAVISGVREYSFANRGVIRSLDILCSPAMAQDTDEPPLFELYAMHSKGVACLLIRQYELGWSKDNKVLDAVDAVKEGVVTVSKLKSPQPPEAGSARDHGQIRIANRGAGKEPLSQSTPAQSDSTQRPPETAAPAKPKTDVKELETPAQSSKESQAEKPERKPRKKKGASSKEPEPTANGTSNPPRVAPTSSKTEPAKSSGTAATNGIPSGMVDAAIAGMEARLTASMSETLKSSLRNLQGKIDEGARIRDSNFNQQQVNLLNMVSEVLNENTQKVLESLIHHQFAELVVPTIGEHAGRAVKDLLQHELQPSVASSVQKEIQSMLPHALNRSLRSADFVNAISDRVGSAVASSMQQDVVAPLTQRLSSTFSTMANQSAQRVANELHLKHQEQFEHMEAQHAADASKIDQLLAHVSQLTDTVSSLAASQSSLQAEIMKLKQQPVHELPGASGVPASQSGSGAPYGMNPPGYGSNTMAGSNPPSHHGSFAASQGPLGPAQPYMNSPQYMRGSQPVAGSHGTAGPSEYAGPTGVGALAGAFANSMSKSEAEEAVVQWIQSGYEKEIFRRSLGAYQPSRFDTLSPILLLVIIATISKDLKPNQLLKQEIDWIEMAVRAFGDSLPNCDWEGEGMGEVMQSASQTMKLLVNRLTPLLASYRDGYPLDPFLAKVDKGKIEWIVRSSEHMLESFGGAHRYD
ncbi:WD40 repeat-like-containing domain [Hirsutella rhossiliensis]|uniref:WD40 repeat-like-containing domain n=1 Tax=Hirsutella rhossiliensis TaxID=111463 RepID=A0A9P8SKU9_9HYPO|nr:WD40 repeat-like-containing domain [Hirsutella rhossiliensis]KAH0966271.1 WD40 repeat-like-containing domain [Hirsutella rhossiliensis]